LVCHLAKVLPGQESLMVHPNLLADMRGNESVIARDDFQRDAQMS